MSQNIDFYHSQIALARTEIKNLRQRISSLKHEHQKEINSIKSTLNSLRCSNCAAAEATTFASTHNSHNDQPSVSTGEITYKPIGYIETVFNNKRGVPRQPTILTATQGVVVIDPTVFNNPEHALCGLAEFSHMWIIFHFHMTESSNVPAKVSPPRLEGERRGVFSTRSPHRPCPIGLSLVKLLNIDGNKIYFNGVDMINGTPVLDIKPYIPQYDYPAAYATPVTTVRPPTEGISDATDTLANLQVDEESHSRNLSPSSGQPLGTDITSPLSRSPMRDILLPQDLLMQISPSPESPGSEDLLDGPIRSPIRRAEIERGAPDGQERFTPPQSALNLNQDGIRVASWVTNPPSRTYQVTFTNDANERLNELIGDRSHLFKTNIQGLLSEDPRSVYVRTRYPDHEYSCVLEDLSISCVFDESACLCTIIAVRSAEDLQN